MDNFTLQSDLKQNRFLLIKDQISFLISDVMFDILKNYQENKSSAEIADQMKNKYTEIAIDTAFVDNALEAIFNKLTNIKPKEAQPDFLHYKCTIVKEGKLSKLYLVLANLFNRYLFYAVFLIGIFTSIYFFYYNELFSVVAIHNAALDKLQVSDILISYILFTGIILIHELGHASASTYFGIKPKEIGFGFYFVFPVFYTNVSKIWELDFVKRNTVNLGGIYFQLIVNIFLIFFFFLNDTVGFVFELIIANTFSMLFSLIPFFRYDGYWILSDTLNIPNLTLKAEKAIRNVLFAPKQLFKAKTSEQKCVTLYALLKMLFWVYVYFSIYGYIVFSGRQIVFLLQNAEYKENVRQILGLVVCCVGLLSTLFFLGVHFFGIVKFFKRNFLSTKRGHKQLA
ncbi:hypothetical protein [Pedobacter sp. MW01-1-1]|uniref:hypothetical protein n=1 Tax=Pedobacter sp. MW01-1-1 TaxID=3383027 RepID=UPI003FEF56C5